MLNIPYNYYYNATPRLVPKSIAGGGDLRDGLCLLRNFSLSAGSSLNMLSSCSSVVDTFTGAVTVHMGGFPDAEFAEVGEVRSGGH